MISCLALVQSVTSCRDSFTFVGMKLTTSVSGLRMIALWLSLLDLNLG